MPFAINFLFLQTITVEQHQTLACSLLVLLYCYRSHYMNTLTHPPPPALQIWFGINQLCCGTTYLPVWLAVTWLGRVHHLWTSGTSHKVRERNGGF